MLQKDKENTANTADAVSEIPIVGTDSHSDRKINLRRGALPKTTPKSLFLI